MQFNGNLATFDNVKFATFVTRKVSHAAAYLNPTVTGEQNLLKEKKKKKEKEKIRKERKRKGNGHIWPSGL